MKNKKKGIEALRSKYGLIFISPWIIGLCLFFLIPIGKSLYYSFADVRFAESGIVTKFAGIENFKYILNADPNYSKNLSASIVKICYSLPVIVIISLILAIILNQKFRGRLFFRGLFFLPVIIATGVVIDILFSVNTGDVSQIGVDENVSANMIDFSSIISSLGIPSEFSKYLTNVFNNIFELVWNSGIQTILFISGLQTIPDLLYEVAKVEGCTKWEEFWYITLPMLSKVITLVVVFTVIELLTTKTNVLMSVIVQTTNNLEYGVGAAMAWFYFIIISAVLGVIMLLLDRLCFRRWR